MKINITKPGGVTLLTAGKICEENITVNIDKTLLPDFEDSVLLTYIKNLEGYIESDVYLPEETRTLRARAIDYNNAPNNTLNIHLNESIGVIDQDAFYSNKVTKYLNVYYPGSISDFAKKKFRIQPQYSLYIDDELVTEITDITEYPEHQYMSSSSRGTFGTLLLERIFIPNGATIGEGGLGRIRAKEIIFEGTINGELGSYAFTMAQALTRILLPTNITKIPYGCFYNAWGNNTIAELVIPEGVTSIEENAFYNCRIKNLILPSTLTTIAGTGGVATSAFNNQAIVTINATTPPTATTTPFNSSYKPAVIYIPAGTLEAYQTATNWSRYSDLFVEMEA